MINEIHKSWRAPLAGFFRSPEGRALNAFLEREQVAYHPKRKKIFAAFKATPFHKVRVVIIGEAPYPCKKNATGLAFSSPILRPLAKAESVEKIYHSITSDLGGKMPTHGNLNHWARQGVFLLNRSLTYHENTDENIEAIRKWHDFTQAVVKALSKDNTRQLHFMLWGKPARELAVLLKGTDHYVYEAIHPKARVSADEDFSTYHNFFNLDGDLDEPKIKWLPWSRFFTLLFMPFYLIKEKISK